MKVKNSPLGDKALLKFHNRNMPNVLCNYHHVQPMPRALLASRMSAWCEEYCEYGWLIQYPRRGVPSFKDTVVLFETFSDLERFRDQYCFDDKYHKRPHERDWSDTIMDNE